MANFKALINRTVGPRNKYVNEILTPDVFFGVVDRNPATGSGTVAPIGSIAMFNNDSDIEFYYKYGSNNTHWRLLADNTDISSGGGSSAIYLDSKTFPESPGNELVDRWLIGGSWQLTSLTAYAVNGVSASAGGTYTLTIRREVDGVETDLLTRDINTGGDPLTDQTLEEVISGAGYAFTDGQFLHIAIESDNADLTGGNGIVITPSFEIS